MDRPKANVKINDKTIDVRLSAHGKAEVSINDTHNTIIWNMKWRSGCAEYLRYTNRIANISMAKMIAPGHVEKCLEKRVLAIRIAMAEAMKYMRKSQ